MHMVAAKFAYHPPTDPVALCRYHGWPMSGKQIKTKGCLFKDNIGNRCTHLLPFTEHDFWQQREVKKQAKKDRKARLNS